MLADDDWENALLQGFYENHFLELNMHLQFI